MLRTLGVAVWRAGERLGIDLVGATEGPAIVLDPQRRQAFEHLVAAARAAGGSIDSTSCPYPLHELLTYLVMEHGLLLHGSNNPTLEVLEPQPARDWGTELQAVVACSDGIWPLFYATVARQHVAGVFSACMQLGRPPRLRRFYMFAVGADPADATTWTDGVVYALPNEGFRREWGEEWVSPHPVRPVLRVPVRPADFPLRATVIGLTSAEEFRRVGHHLRTAKRERRLRSIPQEFDSK